MFEGIMELIYQLYYLILEQCICKKEVTLSAGSQSSYYLDCRKITMSPEGVDLIGNILMPKMKGITAVGGLEVGAISIATAVVSKCPITKCIKGFFVRKEIKKHGLQNAIEGCSLDKNDVVAIVEDVITSGSSVLQAINAVKSTEATISGVFCLVDRLQGAKEKFDELKINFVSLFTIKDFGL